jgi:peptidoglycan/LPS O-acetylase OafA/YrhL
MEYFFYLIYLLAIFIIIVALVYHLTEDDEDEAAEKLRKRINLWGQISYPIILLAGIGIIVYT